MNNTEARVFKDRNLGPNRRLGKPVACRWNWSSRVSGRLIPFATRQASGGEMSAASASSEAGQQGLAKGRKSCGGARNRVGCVRRDS